MTSVYKNAVLDVPVVLAFSHKMPSSVILINIFGKPDFVILQGRAMANQPETLGVQEGDTMGQFFCGYMCRWPLKNPTPVLSVLNDTFRPHLRHFLGIQIQFSQLQLSYFLSLFKLCIFPFLNPS